MEALKKLIKARFIGNSTLKKVLVRMLDTSAVKNKTEVAALTAIPTPASATATECATKINQIIAALKA